MPAAGALLFFFSSVPMIAYGLHKRSILLKAPIMHEERETASKREAEVSESTEEVDAETLYRIMLAKYAERWGLGNARELLDNEIYAYVRSGYTHEEAVRRIARAKGIIKQKT